LLRRKKRNNWVRCTNNKNEWLLAISTYLWFFILLVRGIGSFCLFLNLEKKKKKER